ncbi:MAG: flagellar basal-body MS-ring/collar protein FliF, partial [Vulcanimicrobiaceae bacterium]
MDRLNTMWRDALSRFQIFWSGQSRTSQIGIAGGSAVVLLGAIFLGTLYFGHGPTYGVLFSNLSPEDANTVTLRLKDDKVPYQLSTDGKTISVPAQNVSEERVAIAGAGLLKGSGVGYELFDRTNFGMTDFQERIDKTRAIEGELERTIDGLTPVQAARVNIATPDQTLYTSTQQPTTASIAITTKPGETLSRPQVNGITLLVSR